MNKAEKLRLKAEIYEDLAVVLEHKSPPTDPVKLLNSMATLAKSQAAHLERASTATFELGVFDR